MNDLAKIFTLGNLSSRQGILLAQAIGTRQAESERRRRRILEAARACFGRLGFAGATVETIASEAGVSNGLLYQFFRNKDHLFEVAIGELVRDWARAMAAGEREASAARALEAMFRGSFEFARSNPLLAALLAEDAALQLARFQHRSADRVQAHRDLVARILRRGVAAGEFASDLDVPRVADLICQLQVDYSTRAYRRDPLHPVDDALIDTAVRFVADAVRARGEL
jgi:AcrR family transcriptional regulator